MDWVVFIPELYTAQSLGSFMSCSSAILMSAVCVSVSVKLDAPKRKFILVCVFAETKCCSCFLFRSSY